MLIKFKVANFRSIAAEQTFTLVAGADDAQHPRNLIPCNGYSLLKSAAIYGANASGKSNLINAFRVMKNFVNQSATRISRGETLAGMVPFRLTEETQNQPSLFEVSVLLYGKIFRYGFTASSERVHQEWLFVANENGEEECWFNREYHSGEQQARIELKEDFQLYKPLLESVTRENGLLLAVGSVMNIQQFDPLIFWFKRGSRIIDLSNPPRSLKDQTARRFEKEENFRARILHMMQDADFGIKDLTVEKDVSAEDEESEMPDANTQAVEPMRVVIRQTGNSSLFAHLNRLQIRTQHQRIDSEDFENFDFDTEESNGTQRFFSIAGPILDALDNRRLLIVDELDCSMHSLLTFKLIQFFQRGTEAAPGAQFVFSTHDIQLLDPGLLRRDQMWFAEKNRGASEFYSHHDIEEDELPLERETLQRNYLAGLYGGSPLFGPTFENLE